MKTFTKHARKLKCFLKKLNLEIISSSNAKTVKCAIKNTNAALNSLEDILCVLEENLDQEHLHAYTNMFKNLKSRTEEQSRYVKITLQNLMERRSEILYCVFFRLSRNETSKNSSSHHIASSKLSHTSNSAGISHCIMIVL